MPLILSRADVLGVYAEAAEQGRVHAAFSSENLITTEAILSSVLDHAERLGEPEFPVTIAITHRYPERPQTSAYSPSGNSHAGLRLFQADLAALVATGSPYSKLRVLVHLDHGQYDLDADLLAFAPSQFSSVMFDASALQLEENIAATQAYVDRYGEEVVVEGACDTIARQGEADASDCTSPAQAEDYVRGTGVDLVVANLGTEHRARDATLAYRGDIARAISERIGTRLSLHGTSSVDPERLGRLFEDGIAKVNVWTALERDSAFALFTSLVEHAARVIGPEAAQRLQAEGLLGPRADTASQLSMDYCSTRYRQTVIFESMKQVINGFLYRWYPL
jgi:fructose-bisphosphate aldolase class II